MKGKKMKRLFVAMPYGKRTAPLDYEQPDKTSDIDFDAVWAGILQPAIPEGFETKRADELRQPGLIDRLYNEWLFSADIVLADLTFGNPNVYYELGIRQALSRKGTVLVACKGTKLPFDVRNQYVIHYDYFAAPTLRSFQLELGQAIENASRQEVDSPIHVFLPGLIVRRYQGEKPPEARVQELLQQVQDLEASLRKQHSREDEERLLDKLRAAKTAPKLLNLYRLISSQNIGSVRFLEQLASSLRDSSYLNEALEALNRAMKISPNDSELLREVGFIYRKMGPSFYSQAEAYMERALEQNDQDSELHGMLGGLFRRRGEYERALAQYRRAHELAPDDLYPLVTVAAMNAALGKDVEARDWYRKLKASCAQLVSQNHADHWTYLCLGEAAAALDDQKAAKAAYFKALISNPPVEHVRSELEQLEFLLERKFASGSIKSVIPMLQQYLQDDNKSQ
jgi:tetratricopeptide (TPR) repeat protein